MLCSLLEARRPRARRAKEARALLGWAEQSLNAQGADRGTKCSEVFVGIDTAKTKHSIALPMRAGLVPVGTMISYVLRQLVHSTARSCSAR